MTQSHRLGGAVCVLTLAWSAHARAQTTHEPTTTSAAPAPTTTSAAPAPPTTPATPAPTPVPVPNAAVAAPAAPPARSEPPAEERPRRRTRVGLGGGFAYFSTSDTGSGDTQVAAPGLALELHTGAPILEHWRANFRFNWGLTEFHRAGKLIEMANDIGAWTTGAYVSVFEWSTTKDDYALFRVMGSIFAYVGLIVPYAVAGVFYIMSPFAPTTYLGCDVTGSYQIGDDDLHGYLEAGVGLVSYVHPKYGGLYGGVGPTLGVGVKLGFVNVGVHGTWSPPGAHGEPLSQKSNVYVGGLTATFGN